MANNVKNVGRKRKLRNMDDLFSLLSQVKQRAINLEARMKSIEGFSSISGHQQPFPPSSFSGVDAEQSPASLVSENSFRSVPNPPCDLLGENHTVPFLEEFQMPLLETDALKAEVFYDWFESPATDEFYQKQ
jgi:hypothetical protein